MYNECRHILPSGCKCHSPALSGKPFCYYHANLRRKNSTAGSAAKRLPVPQIEDARGIQLTLQQVLAAVESPFIHRRAIGHTLYGLQLAIQLLGRIQPPAPAEVVRTLCNPDGEPIPQPDQPDQNYADQNQEEQKDQMAPENQLDQTDQMIQTDQTDQTDPIDPSDSGPDLLAPIKTICEPPHDCIHCIHQETCDNYQEPDDDPTFEADEEEEDNEEESETNDEDDEPEDEDSEAAHDENNAEALEDDEAPQEQQLITATLRILQKESPPRNRKTSHRKSPPDPLAA